MMSINKQKNNKLPLISIITVCYNSAKTLEETIQSIVNQTHPNVEYIIIDGGSTDGTVDIIKKYEDKIAYWVSEPDKGVYDAMNKGIDVATGDFINFINSGDSFYSQEVVYNIFSDKRLHQADMIYGDVNIIYDTFERIENSKNINNLWKGMAFSHQSLFASAILMKKYKFNCDNRLGADYEFIYRMYQQNAKFSKINLVISNYLAGGLSDINRIESIKSRWKVVGRGDIGVNFYYIFIIINTTFKQIIKKILPQYLENYILRNKYKIPM